jgi:putative ABC transport system permease protein
MVTLGKIIYESMVQAWQSMTGNKLRTFLSLLGITIGIFCIIAVKSAVDSLQSNIVEGFNELGSDVIYIDKMPWNEDPGQNYWKYAKRPDPSFKDYEILKDNLETADQASYTIFTGGKTIKYRSSSVSNAFIMGSTFEYQSIQSLEIEKGRYFTPLEYSTGANKCILGATTAKELFNDLEPVGKFVRLFGQKYQIIGILKAEGDNMFNFIDFDEVIWVGYNNIKRFVNVSPNSRTVGRMLNVKAREGFTVDELKDEATGLLRMSRRLKPTEKDNFAINELSMLTEVLDKVFGVLNIVGIFIGVFALIVGMFSVANIMFVSVKERTNIIGVKKALGAKRNIILLEFLIESIILCLIGGLTGLILVFIVLTGISSAIPFQMFLSANNMFWGVLVSVIVGIISGVIPAMQASKMDPVEAIRA